MNRRPKYPKPAKVSVGGRAFDAEYDLGGVLRFRRNTIIRMLVDSGQHDTPSPVGRVDLNELALEFCYGHIELLEYTQFYAGLGYSLDGFCDLSAFNSLEVVTPGWIREGKRPWAPKLKRKAAKAK